MDLSWDVPVDTSCFSAAASTVAADFFVASSLFSLDPSPPSFDVNVPSFSPAFWVDFFCFWV